MIAAGHFNPMERRLRHSRLGRAFNFAPALFESQPRSSDTFFIEEK